MSFNFGEMYKQAEAEGSINGYLDPGNYVVTITKGSQTKTQGGKARLTVWFRVTEGPGKGGADRADQMIPDSDSKPGARGAFFGFLDRLGLTPTQLDQLGVDAALATVVGQIWNVTVGTREWQGKTFSDVKLTSRVRGDADTSAPAPAPATTEAAPAPAASEPGPAPAEDEVAALQAQLAEAQTAAAPAPADPAPGARPW